MRAAVQGVASSNLAVPTIQIDLRREPFPRHPVNVLKTAAATISAVAFGARCALRETGNTGKRVKSRIEAQNLVNSILFHNG